MAGTQVKPGAITVKSGDTLIGIAARIYQIPENKTKPHLDEFYREDKYGQLAPIPDVNRLYLGETLYHRPNGVGENSGLSSQRHGSGGRQASDGVKNAKTYKMKNEESLKRIRLIVGKAKVRMKAAISAIKQMNTNQKVKELFEIQFTVKLDEANAVIANYKKMLSAADGVEWHVQTTRPVTAVTGKDVVAFAVYRHYIAIYPPFFYAEGVDRVGVIIHELAHYAFDAGHQTEELPGGTLVVYGGINGADSYEGFAKGIR